MSVSKQRGQQDHSPGRLYSHPTDSPSKTHLYPKASKSPPFSRSLYSFLWGDKRRNRQHPEPSMWIKSSCQYIGSSSSCLVHDECFSIMEYFPHLAHWGIQDHQTLPLALYTCPPGFFSGVSPFWSEVGRDLYFLT